MHQYELFNIFFYFLKIGYEEEASEEFWRKIFCPMNFVVKIMENEFFHDFLSK